MRTPTRHIPNGGGADLVSLRIISLAPIKLITAMVFNNNTAQQYLHIFESGIAPSPSDVPTIPPIPIPGGAFLAADFGVPAGLDLAACTIAISTTPNEYTEGAGDCSITAIVAG